MTRPMLSDFKARTGVSDGGAEVAHGIVGWPDQVEDVLAGDVTAGLAYLTPSGGAVVVAVAPLGLRDRDRGTVTITTSLGLPHKLKRMLADSRVALAFHAREHGFSASPNYVLIQGDARVALEPDKQWIDQVATPAAERFLGPSRTGVFWDRWLREYYYHRVPVRIDARRVLIWPDLRCGGKPEIGGAPLPTAIPAQPPPAGGIVAQVDVERAAQHARPMRHCLIAFRGADGYPLVLPVAIGAVHANGFEIDAPPAALPGGRRRAGLLAHEYGDGLVPIAARQLTGWLTVDGAGHGVNFVPYTDEGFRAPANKTIVLLANGWLAKRGYRKAVRSGTLVRLRRQQSPAHMAEAPQTEAIHDVRSNDGGTRN